MWRWSRAKSNYYLAWQQAILLMLPPIQLSKDKKYSVKIVWKFSNTLSDIDNPVKPLLDCLVKKRGFDDRQIYHMDVTKTIVKKWEDGVELEIFEIVESA